jgi:hypothetical protein
VERGGREGGECNKCVYSGGFIQLFLGHSVIVSHDIYAPPIYTKSILDMNQHSYFYKFTCVKNILYLEIVFGKKIDFP